VFLSVLTIGEICKGIAELPASQKRTGLQDWLDIEVRSWFAGRILPVTEAIAERWGNLAAVAKQKGMTLAVVDGVIAATALNSPPLGATIPPSRPSAVSSVPPDYLRLPFLPAVSRLAESSSDKVSS